MNDVTALFTAFECKSLKLKNRIVMAPMTRMSSPNNVLTDQVVEYYRQRSVGGVGMIITEATIIDHPASSGYDNVPAIYGEEALAGWKKVVDAVHAEGAKIIPQLWHVGGVRKLGQQPNPTVGAYTPSGITDSGEDGHIMTNDDIQTMIAAYAQAAKDAKEIGFDGVEVHCAHGYLIDQFLWEGTNKREDNYGGSAENRSRFAVEVIQAVRKAVGEDFTITARLSQWKMQDYKAKLVNNAEELEAFLAPLVDAGVDVFHCSTRRFWEAEFEGSTLNMAGWCKKLTGKPSITVGSVGLDTDFLPSDEDKDRSKGITFEESSMTDLSNLLDRMQGDEFDLVAVGRGLIANPDWANKVQAGEFDSLIPYTEELLNSQ